VEELRTILVGPMPMGMLDRAALEIATLEYPDLEIEPWMQVLDAHAAAIAERSPADAPGEAYVQAASRYLFDEQGFAGDTANYFDPRHSCLNDVLASRTGIPISLSVVYMEIARRLNRPVYGIGLPGHFIVQYDDGEYSAYLDPFNGGTALTETECFALARRATGKEMADDRGLLAPVTHRQILLRMLNNLRGVHFRRRNFPRALRVLDFLAGVFPEAADVYRERGVVRAQMGSLAASRADLRRYLELDPRAEDRKQIEEQVVEIDRRLAGWN